ncbi:Ankyrin repeat domain-containing protein [Balamuthia mandrillaris]
MATHRSQWEGGTLTSTYRADAVKARHDALDAAQESRWDDLLMLLHEDATISPNIWRLAGTEEGGELRKEQEGDTAFWTPLHYAAFAGASTEVIEDVLSFGAWKSVRNGQGKRPVDLAKMQNHPAIIPLLEPQFQVAIPQEDLELIQKRFHELIHKIASSFVTKEKLRLPELEPVAETGTTFWFPVPGMYGGFSYRFQKKEAEEGGFVLISESWCRVVEGSGQRWEVTKDSLKLLAEGFC